MTDKAPQFLLLLMNKQNILFPAKFWEAHLKWNMGYVTPAVPSQETYQ